MKARSCL